MLNYTHVTRIGTGKDASGKSTYKVVETPDASIPTTLDDVTTLMAQPEYSRMVDVTINEASAEHKQKIKVPFIVKLLINSIGLAVNAKARQGDGIDPLKVAAMVLAGSDEEEKGLVVRIMSGGDKKALRNWAENYLENNRYE